MDSLRPVASLAGPGAIWTEQTFVFDAGHRLQGQAGCAVLRCRGELWADSLQLDTKLYLRAIEF